MSSLVINLALLLFTLGIITVGVQILLLEENRRFLNQKQRQVRKLLNLLFKKGETTSKTLISPVTATAQTKLKTPPTPFEEEITNQILKSFKISTKGLKLLSRYILKLAKIALIFFLLTVLSIYIFGFLKEGGSLSEIFKELDNLPNTIENFLNKTTTPLLTPIFKRFLE